MYNINNKGKFLFRLAYMLFIKITATLAERRLFFYVCIYYLINEDKYDDNRQYIRHKPHPLWQKSGSANRHRNCLCKDILPFIRYFVKSFVKFLSPVYWRGIRFAFFGIKKRRLFMSVFEILSLSLQALSILISVLLKRHK